MSTQIDTEHFRQKLLDERQRVADAIAYLHEENPGTIEDETEEIVGSVDNHLADTASVTVDREIDYTLEENSEHVLAEIDAALGRIEKGTYGVCTNCGRPIEPERLEFLPYATLCIDCKRREERG
jgi:RNA polymerase-binding protein DksA